MNHPLPTPELEAVAKAICEAMGLADSAYKYDAARAAVMALREPSNDLLLPGLIGLVTEIERLNGPRVQLTKAQLEGSEPVDPGVSAKHYMDIGATMRNGLEVRSAWTAMIDHILQHQDGGEG